MVEVELDYGDEWDDGTDWQAIAETAVVAAFAFSSQGSLTEAAFSLSVSINLSVDDEVQALNSQWRGKDKPTNVLSFPMLDADEMAALAFTDDGEVLLGDMILAHGVCLREAAEKGIGLTDHVTHLVIHGTLHLLGYDHIDDAEADHMEAIEAKALASLGLANPYSAD